MHASHNNAHPKASQVTRCEKAMSAHTNILIFQAADRHKHSLLDRAAFERSPAVAGQGSDPDGFPVCTLLQYVLKQRRNTPPPPEKEAHYKDH